MLNNLKKAGLKTVIYLSPKFIRFQFLMVFITILIGLQLKESKAEWKESENKYRILIETGMVWQTRNDVQIPNDENGTRFSLVDLVGNGPYPAVRFYFTWNISQRHSMRLLLAPLSYKKSVIFPAPISFTGTLLERGVPTNATYKFNSWRITYRYRFYNQVRWRWWIGFTAKIRDAKIQLEQAGISGQKTDVGFVPLLHLHGEFHFAEHWWLMFDIDALAGGPGRAEDLALKLGYNLSDCWSISGGYRTLEGGADVQEVYNFAWLHYLIFSVSYNF